MAALYTFVQKTAKQIHDDFLRTVSNGLKSIGVTNPNVNPNSDFDLIATAVGNELAVVQADCVITADQLMPDTASGSYLDRWLAVVGLSRRPAVASSGLVTIPVPSVGSTMIVAGTQLLDSAGQLFTVTTGGTYGNGAGQSLQVPVMAVNGGSTTNHANGDTLRWVTAPPYLPQNVTVGTPNGEDGLSGGEDSEVGNDEPPRQRFYQLVQNPPKGGNAADIASWCTQSTPDIQAAFVYPALQGPATVFFAVCAEPQLAGPFSSTSKSRVVQSALVTGTVVPYVQGQLPTNVYSVGTSTVDQATNVALLLALPSAPTASPPGPGGGWLDGTPWPSTLGNSQVPFVSGVTTSTNFQVNLPVGAPGPTPGVSHIAYISPNTWTMYTATVLSATVVSGHLWTITIDTPFPDVFVGAYIFPQSAQQANYFAAALQAFANLGPGEWTASPNVIGRAFRHPSPTLAWPNTLDANFLRVMENAGPEVKTASFLATGSSSTPAVPASVTANSSGILTSTPPAILTPGNIGFYAS